MSRHADPATQPAERGSWLARHRGPLAGFGAAAVVLAGGVLAFMPHQPPAPSRTVAADCGLVHCSATLPATSPLTPAAGGPGRPGKTPGAGQHTTPAGHPSASASNRPAPAGPTGQARLPAPSPVPTVVRTTAPPPPPAPPLTVSYAVVSQSNGWGGTRFVGRFTLVNHTGAAITGWVLQAGLPNDWVHWVSPSAGGYPWYQDWTRVRDGVAISGPRSSEAIGAHAALVLYFSADGSGTGLSGCSINGSPC